MKTLIVVFVKHYTIHPSMPRPKSDLTGQTIYVAVRTTLPLKQEFQRLGGASWLRRFLSNSIEKNRLDKKT